LQYNDFKKQTGFLQNKVYHKNSGVITFQKDTTLYKKCLQNMCKNACRIGKKQTGQAF